MGISDIAALLGGVALFLFGMTLMGDGLKRVAGERLELILYRLSGTFARGLLLGTGVTAVIQSSCATSVMVVGFVNSGMMKVKRSVGVILGAILGTSITGWVICLSYIEGGGSLKSLLSTVTLTGVVAIIGIVLRMFCKSQTKKHVGDILMGFAVLMFGMSAMSSSVSGLRDAPWFLSVLTGLSNPLLGILVGTVFTAALQSASAAIGIVQALAVTGAMSLRQALPLMMGIAIGAAAPVLLSAIGAGADGKRAALVYPVAGVIGTAVTGGVFYALNGVFDFAFLDMIVDPFSVAAANSLLRLAMLLLLSPLSGVILKIVTVMVKDDRADAKHTGPELRLEERFLEHPTLAVEQSGSAICDMAELSRESVSEAIKLITSYSEEGFTRVSDMENDGDIYEDKLGAYLTSVTAGELTPGQNAAVAQYLRLLTDFERISDHALNLAENAREIIDKQIILSDDAHRELGVLCAAVNEILDTSVRCFASEDTALAARVEPLEDVIDGLCEEIKRRHTMRVTTGRCEWSHGYVYNDILTNLERVADHCSNIALAVIERELKGFDAHGYVNRLKSADNREFEAARDEFADRYALAPEEV